MNARFVLAATLAAAFSTVALAGGGVLHTFKSLPSGVQPGVPLVSDAAGNLYGATVTGGRNPKVCPAGYTGCGTIYKLSPSVSGGYVFSQIYAFRGGIVDGANPNAGLILDASGNLYGTTTFGGSYEAGTVFEL